MTAKHLLLLALVMMMLVPALAAPNTPTITLVGSNNFTMTSTGGTGNCWFRWGVNSVAGQQEWRTPNQTGSPYTFTQVGSPYFPSTYYYVVACDSSGCSATQTFTSAVTTPLPITTYGAAYDNITQNNFNLIFVITALPQPYFWGFPQESYSFALTIMVGLLFAFYLLGLWLRQRKTTVALLVALMSMAFFISTTAGFNWGIPKEMIMLGQLLCSAILAGLILALIKKG